MIEDDTCVGGRARQRGEFFQLREIQIDVEHQPALGQFLHASSKFGAVKHANRWRTPRHRTEFFVMLRLHTQAAPAATGHVRAAPSILTQKPPAPAFVVNTRVQLNDANDGDRAGLIVDAMQYAWLGLANLRLQAGRHAEAEDCCREILRQVPDSARALKLLSQVYDGKGESHKADEIRDQLAAAAAQSR